MTTIVLVTRGKWEEIYEARVVLFNTESDAADFVSITNDPDEKYWTRAKIIKENVYVSLEGKENAH